MLLTRDSLWGWSAAGGRPGGVCLGGGGGLLPGFPRASFQEGSWSLRGSWVLGRPLLGGMGGGEGYTRLPGQGVVGRSQMDSGGGTGDRPAPSQGHHAAAIQCPGPKGMGLQPCGAASGAMAGLGFVGRPVWTSDSSPRWTLGHLDGHLDRLARPVSGARLAAAPVQGRDTQVLGSVCWQGGCPTHRGSSQRSLMQRQAWEPGRPECCFPVILGQEMNGGSSEHRGSD